MPPSTRDAPVARRQPLQDRSRERMERILAVAETLIAAKGSDGIRMSEIAESAGISIGSLYQYFPDKRAIIRTLAEAHAVECRRCVQEAFAAVRDKAGLQKAFDRLVDDYHALMLGRPVMRDIHAGMRADKALMALELAESRVCGALLADAMRKVFPKRDARRIGAVGFLVWQLGEETMRLALSCKQSEGVLLVEAYKRMSLGAITAP